MTELDLLNYLRQNRSVLRILETAGLLGLRDWYVGAGAVCQTVWNIKQGRVATDGINDIDLIYFDSTDLSGDAEAATAAVVQSHYADLELPVEVVNEARVHLWYAREFGFEIPPYTSSESAIDTWPTTASSIGVCFDSDGEFKVYAPFGLHDLDQMIVRPNKTLITQSIYEKKASRWKSNWPELTVVDWNVPESTAPSG